MQKFKLLLLVVLWGGPLWAQELTFHLPERNLQIEDYCDEDSEDDSICLVDKISEPLTLKATVDAYRTLLISRIQGQKELFVKTIQGVDQCVSSVEQLVCYENNKIKITLSRIISLDGLEDAIKISEYKSEGKVSHSFIEPRILRSKDKTKVALKD